MTNWQYQLSAGIHSLDGARNFHLELFGNTLASDNKYSEHKGIDAIRYFLMQKHNWLPNAVRSMSLDDLNFAISEEMRHWTVPKEAHEAYPLPNINTSGPVPD